MRGFRSLKLSLRFVVPLAVALGLLAFSVVPLVDKLTLRWSVRDMDIRSLLISNNLQEPLLELLPREDRQKITNLLQRATQDERLLAVGVCNQEQKLIYRTSAFPGDHPQGRASRAGPGETLLPGSAGLYGYQPP